MDPKVNYTAVGIYVIFLSLALAAIILWLSTEHAKQYRTYLIYMKEPVSGLTEKSTVKFNGVDVGYVDKILLDPEDTQVVKLVVKIDETIPITESTTASLTSQGVTGLSFVGLKAKSANAPPVKTKPGEPYPVIPSEPSVLLQLNEALRDVTGGLKNMGDSFKSMSNRVERLLNDENLASVHNILERTSTASNQFPDAMEKIRGAAEQVKGAAEQVRGAAAQAQNTLQNSEGTMRSLDVALKSITTQTLPEIYQAAHSLKRTMEDVKSITSKVKQNPAAIVRGTLPLPPGPGE